MNAYLSQDLVQFIWNCIDRLETLEALLLLQSAPDRAWTVDQLRREMRSSPLATEKTIALLAARGLLASENGAYRFCPKTPELAATVSQLAGVYRQRPVTIIRTIFSQRNEAAQSFADAFRIKKGPPNG